MTTGRRIVLALLCAVAILVTAVPVALADALVSVQVRNSQGQPADGRVTLTARAGGATFGCATQGGSCRIDGVPGGQYTVTLAPTGGAEPPPPRTVMIPPSGTVSLIVATQ